MNVQVEDIDGVKVLHVSGELTAEGEHSLLEPLGNLLSGDQPRIVLDLAEVRYVNSAGLSELVRLVAQANIQEARIVLANLSAYLAGVLETTRLDRFFEVCPSVPAALGRLG